MNKTKTNIGAMVILAFMFFIFGFVSWVNSILIPYFRISCELTHFESYFVTFAFYIAYFIMAIPSSMLLKKVGFKTGIMVGFIIMAMGMYVFVPAAMVREFGLFLTGLFLIGTGLAILQTAANPFVTIIGPIESAARRISVVGICNKVAGIISPLVFAAVILNPGDSEMFKLIDKPVVIVAQFVKTDLHRLAGCQIQHGHPHELSANLRSQRGYTSQYARLLGRGVATESQEDTEHRKPAFGISHVEMAKNECSACKIRK